MEVVTNHFLVIYARNVKCLTASINTNRFLFYTITEPYLRFCLWGRSIPIIFTTVFLLDKSSGINANVHRFSKKKIIGKETTFMFLIDILTIC